MVDQREFGERYQQAPVEEYSNNVLEAVPKPMVSVRISTYQHADYIRECLDGVLGQETNFPVEILIGEDESDDGTREICKEYADRYRDTIRLFLHRRENNMHIDGRPTGRFQSTYTRFKCRGNYVAICEGDDYWTDPRKLQKQVDFLRKHTGCSICFTATRTYFEHSDSYGNILRPERDNPPQELYALEEFLERSLYFFMGSAVYRNDLWDELPSWYFESPVGDWPFFVLCGQEGHLGYIDEVTCVYRKHREGLWSGANTFDKYHTQLAMRETVRPHLSPRMQKKLNYKIQSIYESLLDEAIDRNKDDLIKKYARKALYFMRYNHNFSIKNFIRIIYFSLYNEKIDQLIREKIYHKYV